jgi:GTPase SAR1 family protein
MDSALNKLLERGSVSWNRCSIMLVGQGRAGKTALANNMMGKSIEHHTVSTIGIEKFERKILHGMIRSDGKLQEHLTPESELEDMLAAESLKMNDTDRISTGLDITGSNRLQLSPVDIDVDVFHKCLLDNTSRNVEGSEVIVSLFDFGGQDIFNALHSFFMVKYGVYVVVFDMELFVSKDEEKRESCMKHLKFWMNSIAMHTYDDKSGKTAPVAIVGTRKDKVNHPEDHEQISQSLEQSFRSSEIWPTLLFEETNGLCFFPVSNFETGATVTDLLTSCESYFENASFVKLKVPIVWLKILDEIQKQHMPFVNVDELERMCGKFSFSSKDIIEMLTFFNEMGKFLWINEDNLRDIVILDPVYYFVKPATLIICKHIATKDDLYHTVHYEKIHEDCRVEWPEDWFQMLEFGLVSDRLARRLLGSSCRDDEHVNFVLRFMERYGLLISSSALYFVPALVPTSPLLLIPPKSDNAFNYLMQRLVVSYEKMLSPNSGEYLTFHFAFSVSRQFLQHNLLSTSMISSVGFLPNGLFERFIGIVFGAVINTVSDVSSFLKGANFTAFKDIVRLRFLFRSVKIVNVFDSNMIRIEIQKDSSSVANDKEILMLIHDTMFAMVQKMLREYYRNLIVITLLPTHLQDFRDHPFLSLYELQSVSERTLERINYTTADGKQSLSMKVDELRSFFSCWLGVPTINPKKGEYYNMVFVYFSICLFLVYRFCR